MTERQPIVYVIDDASIRESLSRLIRSVGLRVQLFSSAKEFLESSRPDTESCLVLDIRLRGLTGRVTPSNSNCRSLSPVIRQNSGRV